MEPSSCSGHTARSGRATSPGGGEVKATLGLAASFVTLLYDPREEVTHAAVAFDNPMRSFRNDLWHGFKSDEGVAPGRGRLLGCGT